MRRGKEVTKRKKYRQRERERERERVRERKREWINERSRRGDEDKVVERTGK